MFAVIIFYWHLLKASSNKKPWNCVQTNYVPGLVRTRRDAGSTEGISGVTCFATEQTQCIYWQFFLHLTVRFIKQIANSNSEFFFCMGCFKRQLQSFPIHRKRFHFVQFRHKLAYKIRNFTSKIKPEIRWQILLIS